MFKRNHALQRLRDREIAIVKQYKTVNTNQRKLPEKSACIFDEGIKCASIH
jgi:hypothetical protein